MRTLQREPAELQNQLRVIYETPGIAPHPLIAHPRVPVDVQVMVSDAILKMAGTPSGKRLLAAVMIEEPVLADLQRDYASLSALGLEDYMVHPERGKMTLRKPVK
jgi:phosphonate transport system substrate-binding protein